MASIIPRRYAIGLSDRNSRACREFGLACMRKKGEDEVVELVFRLDPDSERGVEMTLTWT